MKLGKNDAERNDADGIPPPETPFPKDGGPKLFCGSRKRNGTTQPNCFISFFSKYFPEKASVGNGTGPIDGLSSSQRH